MMKVIDSTGNEWEAGFRRFCDLGKHRLSIRQNDSHLKNINKQEVPTTRWDHED